MSDQIQPFPPRDNAAYALAVQIISLVRDCNRDVSEAATPHDIYRREDHLREEILEACIEFNKHQAACIESLRQQLIEILALQDPCPFVVDSVELDSAPVLSVGGPQVRVRMPPRFRFGGGAGCGGHVAKDEPPCEVGSSVAGFLTGLALAQREQAELTPELINSPEEEWLKHYPTENSKV